MSSTVNTDSCAGSSGLMASLTHHPAAAAADIIYVSSGIYIDFYQWPVSEMGLHDTAHEFLLMCPAPKIKSERTT
jgi:hypothetical protein